MFLSVTAKLAAAAVLATGLSGTAPGPAWRPCTDNAQVDCATVQVPVDWARPQGPKFGLAIARHRATDPARRIGSLVYSPAGPGSSGVEFMTNPRYFSLLISDPVAQWFDVIGIDPRGVGRSNPVLCSRALVDRLPTPTPRDTQAQFDTMLAANRAVARDCRARTGPVFDHIDSASTARDIDAVRAMLGERTISLYGLSYGTVAGQMYAELFPQRIRAMVLDSNINHSLDSRQAMATGARGGQDSFDEFVTWCATEPACALHGKDVRALVGDLYARAERGDPSAPSLQDLTEGILGPLSQPNRSATANWLAALPGHPAGPPAAVAAGEVIPLPVTTFCADHRSGITSQERLLSDWRLANSAAPDIRFWSGPTPFLCSGWPLPVSNPQHRLTTRGAPPVLVLGSRHDPRTPLAWSADVATQLDHAVLLTYDGAGHGVYLRTECTRGFVERYLVERRTPPAGTHCPAA
ncbi:alpha/beta hydrolase [Kutzneria albida]|uniref:TAP domain-containing protein n=1 Tax=Kutzneria albida DSM 43870 TaxID=1449976 RepID=W5W1D8_9PSEU|nr:alpha/beta hydrolase [Kutzneria albida]AHH94356.1 TAP domain-containing protein [Kutzneria albida DSM 43870]